MWSPGIGEIAVILVAALLIFGPKKLPEMGKAIGSAVTEFKKGVSGMTGSDDDAPMPKIDGASDNSDNDDDSSPAG